MNPLYRIDIWGRIRILMLCLFFVSKARKLRPMRRRVLQSIQKCLLCLSTHIVVTQICLQPGYVLCSQSMAHVIMSLLHISD
jgi:hypothetical protein